MAGNLATKLISIAVVGVCFGFVGLGFFILSPEKKAIYRMFRS